MIGIGLRKLTVVQLVGKFVDASLGQFDAELNGEIAKFNRLYDELEIIERELKNRDGDQRSTLVPLFDHKNPQVRLNAAEATLVVAPTESRQTLQEIWDRKEFPQAAYAMGTLRALERGDRKPT